MDQDGLPVAGVDVAALSYQFSNGERFLGSSTQRVFRTDETGQYRMFGLMAGAYFIRAEPSNSLGKTDKSLPLAVLWRHDNSRPMYFINSVKIRSTPMETHQVVATRNTHSVSDTTASATLHQKAVPL